MKANTISEADLFSAMHCRCGKARFAHDHPTHLQPGGWTPETIARNTLAISKGVTPCKKFVPAGRRA